MQQKAKTKNISIVLYKPKHAGNIGSIARVAKNMGVGGIIVVGAKDFNQEEMMTRSTHLAADYVDAINYYDDISEALASFTFIVGTTARLGKARGPFVSPRAAASQVAQLSPKNKIALLFGPEDKGLSNDELRYCQAVVHIPTSREFTSLNLSHAVMILCYEIFTATLDSVAAPEFKRAHSAELEGMYRQIKELLAEIGFLNPENPDYWMTHLHRFLNRGGLLSREVKIIRGICRQLTWYANRKKEG